MLFPHRVIGGKTKDTHNKYIIQQYKTLLNEISCSVGPTILNIIKFEKTPNNQSKRFVVWL